MKFRLGYVRAIPLAAVLSSPLLSASNLTTEVTPNPGACTTVYIPRWKADWIIPAYCELRFRASGSDLLVGVYCTNVSMKEGTYSPGKYSFKLVSGHTQKVSEEEWRHANVLPDSRVNPRDARIVHGVDRLIYKGKRFRITGGLESIGGDALRLSGGGSFLGVNSWSGVFRCNDGLFGGCNMHGQYYVDLYDVKSGRLALAISGQFSGRNIFSMFQKSAWISDHYFVLPEDERRGLSRFLICDVKTLSNAPDENIQAVEAQAHPQ